MLSTSSLLAVRAGSGIYVREPTLHRQEVTTGDMPVFTGICPVGRANGRLLPRVGRRYGPWIGCLALCRAGRTRIAGQPVVRNRLPRCCGVHELAVLRTYHRISVKGPETHDDLSIGKGITTKERRAADRAEMLRNAGRRLVGAKFLASAQQGEALARNETVRRGSRTRSSLTVGAMAVASRGERARDLVADGPAEAASPER